MRFYRVAALLVVASLLAGTLALQTRVPETQVDGGRVALRERLPEALLNFHGAEMALGPTESVTDRVYRVLGFDDYIYRRFKYLNHHIDVYIAYWRAGRIDPRQVAAHTPDVCWTKTGMTIKHADLLMRPEIGGCRLVETQGRVFEHSMGTVHVWFWHLHDGRSVSYYKTGVPPFWAPFADMWRHGLRIKGEQYFVRISSSEPLDSPELVDVLKALLAALAAEGIQLEAVGA